ncbi:MAG: insulinase family protein [Verrucomicrobiales bacterium]
MLGENMSSRLWQSLRERRGLCYHASSEAMAIADTGMLHAYAGMDPENARKAAALIAAELTRAMDRLPGKRDPPTPRPTRSLPGRLALERTTSQMMGSANRSSATAKSSTPMNRGPTSPPSPPPTSKPPPAPRTNRTAGGAAVVGPVESAEPLLEPFQSL